MKHVKTIFFLRLTVVIRPGIDACRLAGLPFLLSSSRSRLDMVALDGEAVNKALVLVTMKGKI